MIYLLLYSFFLLSFIFSFFFFLFFFFNDTATTEIYTLSLHDALPIYKRDVIVFTSQLATIMATGVGIVEGLADIEEQIDRKSTRLNSSHGYISYAVFCLKKKKKKKKTKRNKKTKKTRLKIT